jgi:hypothetical protein
MILYSVKKRTGRIELVKFGVNWAWRRPGPVSGSFFFQFVRGQILNG